MFLAIAALAAAASPAEAPARSTDFGVRTISSGRALSREPGASVSHRPVNLQAAVEVGSRWGRVTSTRRSAARNRAVGGVRNSHHLYGRAIDIARRPGVSHAAIAAAYRNAGFRLIESLDEGDHSHFAFGAARPTVSRTISPETQPSTQWRMVTAPSFTAR